MLPFDESTPYEEIADTARQDLFERAPKRIPYNPASIEGAEMHARFPWLYKLAWEGGLVRRQPPQNHPGR